MRDSFSTQNHSAPRFQFGAVLLAAGKSRRMGRPKLLLDWGGKTVLDSLLTQWKRLRSAQIAIVHREGDEPLCDELHRVAVKPVGAIPNANQDADMFSSLRCASRWPGWNKRLTHFVIILGDQPHLQDAMLEAFLGFSRQNRESVCQPRYQGRARHPVILPRDLFFSLARTRAQSLAEFLNRPQTRRAFFEVADPGVALDLDTSADYKKARRLFSRHKRKLTNRR